MKTNLVDQEKIVEKEQDSLKGTMFSVGVVGAVILIMWVGVFALYMVRI